MQALPSLTELENPQEFLPRHLGISGRDASHMLDVVGAASLQALIDSVVPASIASDQPMDLPPPATEVQALTELRAIAQKNTCLKSFIGQGYHRSWLPAVIQRNVLENPAWYTAYTPYQAEISQGRMEALLNFQTMVTDLTAMDIANASMLDEATAAAEAMALARRSVKNPANVFLVGADTHPQTIAVIRTRAAPLNIEVRIVEPGQAWDEALAGDFFAALLQYPGSSGLLRDFSADVDRIHARQAALIVAADLLALTLLKPPGEMGADICIGSSQRFGMPMGAGGPHAAFMACRDRFKRSLPGRLVGVSLDTRGNPAYRLALQTREQHIRREKATSNICTAQVLPAVIAGMYALYHGPQGLTRIASRVARYTAILARGLRQLGHTLQQPPGTGVFDTLCLHTGEQTAAIAARAVGKGANLRIMEDRQHLCISLDETTSRADIELLWSIFSTDAQTPAGIEALDEGGDLIPAPLRRSSTFLTHAVFNSHHSETGMLRYLRRLADKDLALDRSMIALGSCTMKLNATSEMLPVSWPEFADIHPYAPADQLAGYAELDRQLCQWLAAITGYAGISLQPNAGSQGEFAGLLAIKAWHEANGNSQRNICLIPASAHGTNPASAQMAGMKVVVSACDKQGNVDLDDLRAKCEQYSTRLACVMITYPSTHGVFESGIRQLCETVHQHGGRVYVDGANMNAMVGLARPGSFGGDVSHLNLHKTFCIPHGGGGPGVGPVCVAADLTAYLPGSIAQSASADSATGIGAISAAPLGNAGVLPISWMYIRMMGDAGLRKASETAILSANYISVRLRDHYPTLYHSENGRVAHECILDLRPLKASCGISAEDVAKRLIDYGFHAPTLSFPVPGTLMVEPTESESLAEIERFIEAMISIREEIRQVENGQWPADNNPLTNAPHTAAQLLAEPWSAPYCRKTAAYPLATLEHNKYWSPVGRVDNAHGDRNLFCSCIPTADHPEHPL